MHSPTSKQPDHTDLSQFSLRIATLRRLWRTDEELGLIWPADRSVCRSVRMLDIRPATEFLQKHIPGSVSIPEEELPHRTPELPPKWAPFVVLADATRPARRTADELRERGWTGAAHLAGSVSQWPGPWESGPGEHLLWEPTQIVKEWAERLPPGQALDLGCGSGRDAVYLALYRHQVTAVDLLPDALEKASSLAGRCGIELVLRQMDLRKQRPPVDSGFDLVTLVRFLDRDLLDWIPGALRSGGHLLVETFLEDEAASPESGPTPGPRKAIHRLAAGEALERCLTRGLSILTYQETEDRAGAKIVRLAACKS